MPKKAFGSGYFGEWIADDFGLPAYRYTCNQLTDPKAISPTNEEWRPKTEHLHQVGNDRLVGVASNYGYVQVRQDEGSPKFLNDQDPTQGIYAGGGGYLTDGTSVLSTFYPGHGDSFERIFGMGYYRKVVVGTGLIVDHIIFAPFGDDPLLISQVTITNNRNEPISIRWLEYWGCQMYQFSYKALIQGLVSKKVSTSAIRRQFSQRFEHHYTPINGQAGILAATRFLGEKFSDKLKWAVFKFFMATFFRKLSGGRVKSPVKEAVFEDITPPPVFLISLDAPADGQSVDPLAFFGKGGIELPDGLQNPLPVELKTPGQIGGMVLERKLNLNAGENKTLYFAYGYLPRGFDLEALISKYKTNLLSLLSESCEKWKAHRIALCINNIPWVDRELLWHHYYLRSNLTYDSFFKEHILSQGHVYQYIVGFQGAARDPIQHALPFIYSNPIIVREIIRYTLKEMKPNGAIPYGICGSGMVQPSPFAPSDLELWLLWITSEYVLATRDSAFLNEEIPTYPLYGSKAGKGSVKDLLARCYNHLVTITGTGLHGLQRLSNGDWNDNVVQGYVPKKHIKTVTRQGESVLNAAMATFVLDIYSQMLMYINEITLAQDAKVRAALQRKAVSAQWNGRWFRRAWLSEELGWVGDDILWLEPQPWTIIGNVTNKEQNEILLKMLDAEVRRKSKIGATLLNKPVEKDFESPGMGTAAGIWPSINGTLIWALSLLDGEMAWDEWKKNSLAVHAEEYPEVWYGIWSGPDTYNSHFSKYPGQTAFTPPEFKPKSSLSGRFKVFWTDFPVMNMHPHAWPIYSVTKLLGIRCTPEGIELAPSLPKDEYTFASPLIGLEKSKAGYSGWYAPLTGGTWKITFQVSAEEAKTISYLEVNGKEEEITLEENKIIFSGSSTSDTPLSWKIMIKL